ncbi:MAG: hypothetical protein A3D44_04400 [Candidatus Staskawiczbacteria bacterium RIFCSPHIGHO2_02_FULL_42_22]|uniref:Uncharacterized protein n=1 Tax=Candidatus Staskawiczbacteria bacterium RIFCSPHIGHO2_02_FULL_42_22 TaxID=1802207 RepID=A0A1G2I4T5_9BACT|nr:MAG: hypothetical protein A3D44_04400 [Candidatus Staskawiczbacteria bacterium RIFCSPHIGHO2_02_FULL_42_22]
MPRNIESQPNPDEEPKDLENFSYALELLHLSPSMSARGFLNHINADITERLELASKKNPSAEKRLNLITYIQSILGQEQLRLSEMAESDPERAKNIIDVRLRNVGFKSHMEELKEKGEFKTF